MKEAASVFSGPVMLMGEKDGANKNRSDDKDNVGVLFQKRIPFEEKQGDLSERPGTKLFNPLMVAGTLPIRSGQARDFVFQEPHRSLHNSRRLLPNNLEPRTVQLQGTFQYDF